MTGPELTRAVSARHRGPAPVDTDLEELVGTDVIDVEVEPVGRPLFRFTVAATLCILGVLLTVLALSWALESLAAPLSMLYWVLRLASGDTANFDPGW